MCLAVLEAQLSTGIAPQHVAAQLPLAPPAESPRVASSKANSGASSQFQAMPMPTAHPVAPSKLPILVPQAQHGSPVIAQRNSSSEAHPVAAIEATASSVPQSPAIPAASLLA